MIIVKNYNYRMETTDIIIVYANFWPIWVYPKATFVTKRRLPARFVSFLPRNLTLVMSFLTNRKSDNKTYTFRCRIASFAMIFDLSGTKDDPDYVIGGDGGGVGRA